MSARPVLALVTDAFGGLGGIAQYNRDLLSVLAETFEVVVLPRFAPRPAGELPVGLRQDRPRQRRAAYALAAMAVALRVRPDTVFCGHLYMAPLAAAIAKLAGARMVLQLHGVEAWERPGRLRRASAEAADLVLCVSRETRARFLGWAAIEPERVAVLPNTVGAAFRPGDRAAARARFGLNGERVLLSVGRLDARERYKGHDRIIDAMPALAAEHGEVLFLVAGTGEDRLRLEALAARHGVSDRVRFLGYVPDEALPDLYRAADLFAMPSTGEGFGIAYLEAMACGTPSLGLAAGGARDALADGALGTAVDPTADFAAALIRTVEACRPDLGQLSAEVAGRFGRERFRERALTLLRVAADPNES